MLKAKVVTRPLLYIFSVWMEECHTTTAPPLAQAAQAGVLEDEESTGQVMLDLPVVHTAACGSCADVPSAGTEPDSDESPIPGTSGLSVSQCQDIPSPPYAASFPGLLSSMPSTSQTASSPLLDTCGPYSQPFMSGTGMDLSATSDDQLSGTCMPASGTLSGFQGAGAYSPLPMLPFGESSALSCSALKLPAYDSKSNLSETASALLAICRICHQPGDEYDILISPCRCAGTLQFIHNTCLMVSLISWVLCSINVDLQTILWTVLYMYLEMKKLIWMLYHSFH